MKPKTFLKAAGLLIGTYGPRACAGRIIPLERAGGTSNANLPLKHNVDNSDLHGLDIVGNSTVATLAATQARAPISDEEWEALGLEGCRLLKAMASTNAEAAPYVGAADSAESPWKDFGALEAWGWKQRSSLDWRDGERPRLDEPLAEYGISALTEGNPNYGFSGWEHAADSVHGAVTYPKTLGLYHNIFNIREGVIVRAYNWGPRYKANRFKPPITPLPALRNWADVIYLDWMHTASSLKPPATGKKLQLVIAHAVASDKTIALIDRALREVGRDPKDTMLADKECPQYRWKNRVSFPLGEGQPGNPLLASPNGLGQSLLLIRNKGTFGAKTGIDRITSWCKGSEFNLLFHVNQSG